MGSRQPDLERAKELMVEAGYPAGIDPKTGEALKITFDSYNTSTDGLIQHPHVSLAWADHAQQGPDSGRLARAVQAEKAVDLARLDAQADRIHGPYFAVEL